ncbi:MAG TPA: orotidine-5'-phosphate decarboxylase [Steroidobacter sp.]
MQSFAERLKQRITESSPLCLGVDPSSSLLQRCSLPDSAEGALEFGKRVLEAADYAIALLKPQSAFFERFGSAGYKALEELTGLARSREVLVLIDGKRGDIDSTAAAYAESYFGPASTLPADAITVNAYLGFAALEPFFSAAAAKGAGVFVVVRSSNPEGQALQTARLPSGATVAETLCDEITARNQKSVPDGLGFIGAVVGATCDDAEATVARLPQSFILAPGVGAQGATIEDVLRRMPSARGRVLPNVSRAVLANGSTTADMKTTLRTLKEQARSLL